MYPFALQPWLSIEWLIPTAGALACGLTYLMGRRLLLKRRRRAPSPSSVEECSLLESIKICRGVRADRRSAPRRRGNTVEIELLLPGQDTPLPAWIVDRSAGGLGILVEKQLPLDSTVQVRPGLGENIPWTEAYVRSCRTEGSHFEVGLQFHRTPNWNLMLQFG